MNRNKSVKLVVVICLAIALATTMTFAVVQAQEPEPQPSAVNPVLYTIGAWLLYSILGLIASLVTPVPAGQTRPAFDASKFARSFLWAVVVALISVGLGVSPNVVETQQVNLVSEVVNFIGNSGFGLSLIYFFDKLYRIITGLATGLKTKATTT